MIDALCPIFQSGKGFCWAPSAAWGCTNAELCVKCQAKPRTATPVQPIFPVNQWCQRCGAGTYRGRSKCNKCLQYPDRPVVVTISARACRFCGQQNVHYKQWREKDRMCSQKACWKRFIEEVISPQIAI